jgi:hypothetical protein
VKFISTKKGRPNKNFLPVFCSCWIQDPGWKQIRIRIRDKHTGYATREPVL